MGRKKKSLEDAINNVLYQLDDIAKQTAKDVAKKVKKDMQEQAQKAVKHYYDSYRPEVYDRTFALYHSYRTVDETSGDRVKVTLLFDPALIDGEHGSSSKYHQTGDVWRSIDWPNATPKGDDYGVPQSDWILNNFWEGLHPITTGNKYIGFEWNPKKDKISPQDMFNMFVDGTYIESTVTPYASKILTNRVLDALKQQFR